LRFAAVGRGVSGDGSVIEGCAERKELTWLAWEGFAEIRELSWLLSLGFSGIDVGMDIGMLEPELNEPVCELTSGGTVREGAEELDGAVDELFGSTEDVVALPGAFPAFVDVAALPGSFPALVDVAALPPLSPPPF
jgi:hypothetical protein